MTWVTLYWVTKLTEVFILFDLQSGYESYCRAVSVAVHFFFTATFVWMLLEAIYVYSVLVRRSHRVVALGKAQNILIGKLLVEMNYCQNIVELN